MISFGDPPAGGSPPHASALSQLLSIAEAADRLTPMPVPEERPTLPPVVEKPKATRTRTNIKPPKHLQEIPDPIVVPVPAPVIGYTPQGVPIMAIRKYHRKLKRKSRVIKPKRPPGKPWNWVMGAERDEKGQVSVG